MKAAWPAYRTLRPLIHAHLGRTAVIMGGGPTLPDAVRRAPIDAIYISANDHGCRLLAGLPAEGRSVDYIVALDRIEHKVRSFGVPIISRHMYADFRLLFAPAKDSGIAGAYVARLMGCAPILLAGMDLYEGGTYFDDHQAKSSGLVTGPQGHAMHWRDMVAKYPGGQYRVLGGNHRLQNIFGLYDPMEQAAGRVARATLEAEIAGITVEVKHACVISLREFRAGERVELNKNEAEKFIKKRQVQRVIE